MGPGEGVVHHAGDVDGVEAGPPGHHHQPPGRGVDHHPAAGRHLILQCGDLSHITHYTLCITRYALHVTHYALHITRYTLHVTRYTLYITHYTIYITHKCNFLF